MMKKTVVSLIVNERNCGVKTLTPGIARLLVVFLQLPDFLKLVKVTKLLSGAMQYDLNISIAVAKR